MNVRKSFIFTLAGLAISASGIASASSFYHSAGGEVGFTSHPEHLKTTKTRNEVMQEVSEARKDGSLALLQRGKPLPVKNLGAPATREQVQQEFFSMSVSEKRRQQEMYLN